MKINAKWLRYKYIDEHKSARQIQALLGFKSSTYIYVLLKKYKIKRRSLNEAWEIRSQRDKIICKVEGCGKKHFGRGYCVKHYTRWRNWGDPNILKHHPLKDKTCPVCKKVFKKLQNIHCSLKCAAIFHRTEGAKILHNGYIWVKIHNHPSKNSGNYVKEHRLIMEKKLGRYLLPTEIVHHINGNKTDNREENLELFSSSKQHGKLHRDMQLKNSTC